MASAGSPTALVLFLSAVTALLVTLGAASAGHLPLAVSPAAPGAIRQHCNGSIAQCVDGAEWLPAGLGVATRRSLAGGYIGYRGPLALNGQNPVYHPAKSGYPYGHGCINKFRCRRESYM